MGVDIMESTNWHEILFNYLTFNGNTQSDNGKYVCFTEGNTQNIIRTRKENAFSASAFILYGPKAVLDDPWLKGTYIHVREDFYNDSKGNRKQLGKRYHKDVYDLFDKMEPQLELVGLNYPIGDKDPYHNWLYYVVKDGNKILA